MPISTIREARHLTTSDLATMALQADQARRRAKLAGDFVAMREHDSESAALARLSREVPR